MLTDKEFENKLTLNQTYILGYARALTKTCREYEAEDLLQDTNLRAWEKRAYYKQDDSFTGWLCFMMHNIFINYVIKTKLKMHYDSEYNQDGEEVIPLVERYSSPSINDGEGSMTLDLIDEALCKLEGRDRDIVQRYIAGETQAAIGISYGMKDNAVKQRYFHAIKIVRAYLLEKGIEFNNFIAPSIKEKQSSYRRKQSAVETSVKKKLDKQNKNNEEIN
jgi:RNA polymerase sigma factor (sigma-70 family)